MPKTVRTRIYYILSREGIKLKKSPFIPLIFTMQSRKINGNHRKFYNFPNIFCSIAPSPRTSSPHSPVPFHRRNRGKRLYPYTFLPTRQNVFRNFCICIVKMAFLFLLTYAFQPLFSQQEIKLLYFHKNNIAILPENTQLKIRFVLFLL